MAHKAKQSSKNDTIAEARIKSFVFFCMFLSKCRVESFVPQIVQSHSFPKNQVPYRFQACTQNGNPPSSSAIRTPPIETREDFNDDEYEPKYPPRNPSFKDTNVITQHYPIPYTSFIRGIMPPGPKLWDKLKIGSGVDTGRTGVDATVEFHDAKDGAEYLVRSCLVQSNVAIPDEEIRQIGDYISKALSFFQEHIPAVLYKARIVSSVGSVGQKCPRWHTDHVPLRLVMSLAGPGCVYVPFEKEIQHPFHVNRDALNGLDEADSSKANEVILPLAKENVVAKNAKEGDAILLMGRAWETEVGAAPHRSPDIGIDQLRVLLVVDVVA